MGGGDTSGTVNSPIDSPVNNGSASDRPLVSWILSDEKALAQYHEVYSRFIAEVIESGWLKSEIARVSEMIRPYVEADANIFYTTEEFDTAIEALQSYCDLRGESIRGQLEGTIPSTSEGQKNDNSALVDTGDLNLTVMGTMNTGGGGPGGNGGPSMSGGEMQTMPGGMPSMQGEMPSMPSGEDTPSSGQRQPPEGFTPPDSMNGGNKTTDWITFGACMALLLIALVTVSRIKGHN